MTKPRKGTNGRPEKSFSGGVGSCGCDCIDPDEPHCPLIGDCTTRDATTYGVYGTAPWDVLLGVFSLEWNTDGEDGSYWSYKAATGNSLAGWILECDGSAPHNCGHSYILYDGDYDYDYIYNGGDVCDPEGDYEICGGREYQEHTFGPFTIIAQ